MPRVMPGLAKAFEADPLRAVDLSQKGETARANLRPGPGRGGLISLQHLELLYELAYLRVFLAWEVFLEESFLRYMCGYAAGHGQEIPTSGKYFGKLETARAALYNQRDYVLWHNPTVVLRRVSAHIDQGRHEGVIRSIAGRLESFARVRHRIAHSQPHAKTAFDQTTMSLCGKRFLGSRPGRFLRDFAPGRPAPVRWLTVVTTELTALAFQITP